jgi:hypothetical protein
MKKLVAILTIVSLSGCAAISDMIPSFWDDNQAKAIIDVRQSVDQLDCKKEHAPQAQKIYSQIQWLNLYSESKGNKDMLRLIKPMGETAREFVDRSNKQQGSEMYCELKKKLLITQSTTAAKAIHGRF